MGMLRLRFEGTEVMSPIAYRKSISQVPSPHCETLTWCLQEAKVIQTRPFSRTLKETRDTLVHWFNIALAQWIFPPSLSLSFLPSFLSTLPPLPLYIIFYVFVTFPSCLPSFFAFIHTLHLLRFLFIPSNFSSCFFLFTPFLCSFPPTTHLSTSFFFSYSLLHFSLFFFLPCIYFLM